MVRPRVYCLGLRHSLRGLAGTPADDLAHLSRVDRRIARNVDRCVVRLVDDFRSLLPAASEQIARKSVPGPTSYAREEPQYTYAGAAAEPSRVVVGHRVGARVRERVERVR